ncbi:DUF1566 domain-containing protein [Oceanobacter sp. 2_MG-2023]|uniref:PKD domain-containing protein n=2 Tax=unclassified Oceanobacter TaxID=2620260 RepID=UPI0027366F31|nr:DUF1566 domain-containing protein [Oceanobacter sp. 2_MG-2023]MDP2610317.1 DUF1566 domain-containing protein [Oceanobacter sp. 1_MG-2023]MDP2613545.1 DUF1566 domain-containing protein [Oceanobacter sp. 2_MG-2023]
MMNASTGVGMVKYILILMLVGVMAGCGSQSGPESTSDSDDSSETDTDTDDDDDTDDEDSDSDNIAPVANAGSDQSSYEGATVSLPGSGIDEDGTVVLYEWAQLSGTDAEIVNPNSANTSVVLPDLTVAEDMIFSLTVTDDDGASDTDTMTLSVAVEYDETGNLEPTVDAGKDQEVNVGETVYLEGEASDQDGNIVSYEWIQSTGTDITLSDETDPEATFVAPDVTEDSIVTLVLKVTDEQGAVSSDEVLITIFPDLAAPDNLAAESDEDGITLTWDEVDSAESYNVYYARETIPSDDIANYSSYLGGTLEMDITTTSFLLESDNDLLTYYFRVTAARDDYESSASDEVIASTTIAVTVGATGNRNDTGLTTCYEESEAGTSCPIDDFPQQDGDEGRDADDDLVKTGYGDAGFDFLKIDSEGNAVGESVEDWRCVFDVNTGLLWESKLEDEYVAQSVDERFTWYSTDNSLVSGTLGEEGDTSACYIDMNCNTQNYIAYINDLELCGYSNWRLPTVDELVTIVHHGETSPTIDTDLFPNTRYVSKQGYWTSDINYDGVKAWVVDFSDGDVTLTSMESSSVGIYRSIRLVVGEE